MSPPTPLFRRWQHSFEEDHDGVQVYRPAEFNFPPARGRSGLEFQPDGAFIRYAIGRGDAPAPQPGRWRMAAPSRWNVQQDSPGAAEQTIDIVRVDDQILEIRQS
jgi:hypothetical protein